MNSFAQNINYIAGLDNVYGSKVELYKNNLSLKNVEHDIELKFSYYNNDDKKIHSIIHSEPGVLVGEINDVLLSFKSLVDATISGSEFTCTVSSGVQNFVVNNVVMISIAIDSHNDTYKAYELEAKVITAGAVTYDVFGEVSDTLKILPSLAMITSSDIDAMTNVYEIQDEVITVSDNVTSVRTVSDSISNVNTVGISISNVNIVGEDITNVNTVSTHISNVDTVSQSITNVNTVGSNIVDVGIASTNIASIKTVANAKNLSDIIRVADDLNSLDVNGIADITIVANDLVLGTDSNIITVSDSIVNVNTVSDSINNVNTVGTNITDVSTVSTNIANVNITATDIASVNNVSSNIADVNTVSDGIANVNTVSDSITNVNTVATNIGSVKIAGSNISNINNVGSNITSVNTVSANINSVNNVSSISDDVIIASGISDDISAVALIDDSVVIVSNNINSVNTVSSNIGNVNIVGTDIVNVNKVANIDNNVSAIAPYALDIETVADNIGNVNASGSNINYINIVSNNIDSIITDANNIGDIVVVANDLSKIKTVAYNISEVFTAGSNITSIIGVNANETNINSIVSDVIPNMAEILLSDNNAAIATAKALEASVSEALAHKWADNPENVPVTGTIGVDEEYSAYHWAKKAEAAIGGSIALNSLYDVDTTGLLDGGMIRYDLATTSWKSYDFARNDKLGLDLTANTTVGVGEIAWNATEGTADLGLPGGSTLQIGQENVRTVRNATASTISNGRLCMFDGTIGNSGRIKVKPFTAGFNEAIYLYGVATQSIPSGSDGIITIEGKVRGIDTTGASVGEVWAYEDILYAKPNDNGMMTNIEPADNELKLVVATVIHSHPTNGCLEIRFTPFNENMYYTKVQNDILLNSKVPLEGDFTLDLGGII